MGKKMTVLRGVPGEQSVFGYKVLGRGTDAGRVFTFWGRARAAVQAAQGVQPLGRSTAQHGGLLQSAIRRFVSQSARIHGR